MEDEQVIDIDMEVTIAQAMRQFKSKKKKTKPQPQAADILPPEKDVPEKEPPAPEFEVSLFDYSVENHFRAMDKIAELCGESELQFDQKELQRLSSSITFLRQWKHFHYQPRVIRFACQSENHQGKDVIGEINLPQFSAAIVPKKVKQTGNAVLSESGTGWDCENMKEEACMGMHVQSRFSIASRNIYQEVICFLYGNGELNMM